MLARALALGVVAAAFSTVGCGSDGAPRPAGSLTWQTCHGSFSCSSFDAPIDAAHPDAGSFSLPVVRLEALSPDDRIGVLFVNPGGPGGSGVDLALAAPQLFPPELLDKFDIVGFDPRGAAGSDPALDCESDLDSYIALDLVPSTPAKRTALIDQNRDLANACEKKSGKILPFVSTERVAADMDKLREDLGEEKLSYVGYSYGTFLGALYADAFPTRVRAFVLDGAVDPASDGASQILGQAFGFESELDAFLDDCKADATNPFHEGGDPASAYDALIAKIDKSPIPVTLKGQSERHLGPGEAWYAVTQALYDQRDWAALAQGLADAEKNDGTLLLEFSDESVGRNQNGTYDNFLEAYLSISAIDTVWPTTMAAYDKLADQVRPKAPRVGVALVYNSIIPMFWAVPPERKPAPIAAKGTPPIVVIGTTGDPATPYTDAQALASELDSGVLLTWKGDGHTAFGGKSACIDAAVTSYLVDLTAPAKGKTCD